MECRTNESLELGFEIWRYVINKYKHGDCEKCRVYVQ